VREGEWLDGWAEHYEVIRSESGLAEPGCVFRTTGRADPETIWTITEHDHDRGVVEFVRVTAGLVATTLRLTVHDNGDGSSAVAIRYAITPTSPDGEAFAAGRYGEDDFRAAMVWWERSMNHFLQTGQMLREPAHH
jgi:hypothetical protein